jgi:aminoglycoside N3'-acetyltransferase
MRIKAEIRRVSKMVLPHSLRHYRDLFFRRVEEEELRAFFAELGVRPGMTLYVQSAFNCIGYYPKGAPGFIELLRNLLGPAGTIIMPSFPFSGSMEEYTAARPVFDVRATPAAIGYLPEVFRTFPGVIRSIHPTHPVAALGRLAAEITAGHEKTLTPQGEDSPFGALARADAFILRIGAAYYPLFHHLQEKLDYPNQFLPEPVTLRCVDYRGRKLEVTTRVHRPSLIPFIFRLEAGEGAEPVLINFSDFPVLFGGRRERRLKTDPLRREGWKLLAAFRRSFTERYGLASGLINGCFCDLFSAAASLDFAVGEGGRLLDRYRDFYQLSRLEKILAEGRFSW